MKKTVLSVLKYLLLLGIGVALLLLAFKGVDIKKTFAEMKEANLWWLGLSVLVSLVAFLSRAYRWNLLIEPLGYKPSMKNTTSALMVGYLANLAVPRLGEVSRCGSLAGAEKIPFEKLLGTVIVERVIDVLSLLIVIIITVIVQFNLVRNFIFENIVDPLKDKVYGYMNNTLLLLALVVGLIIIVGAVIYFLRSKTSSKLMIKIRELLKGIVEGVRSVRDIRSIPVFLFHSIFIWVMYYYMAYLGFFALGATAGLSWQAGLLILVAGGIGMSAPVQGGIGTYHLLVSQGLIIYGVAKEHGMAYATLIHGSQVLVIILFGTIGYLVLWFGNKRGKMQMLDLIRSKVLDAAALQRTLAVWRLKSKKIVFTNGCFDILHLGHVDYLAKASDKGDMLIVGVNSDASTKKLKGPHRPINNEEQRSMLIAALHFVDAVVVFNEDTPYELIKVVQPDVLVKGADYAPHQIAGNDIVTAKGGEVTTIEFLPGYSTSLIIEKIKKS